MPIKPTVVELQALATELRLRASVGVQQIDAATQTVLLQALTEYVQLRGTIQAAVLDAATQYVLLKADAIVGEFIKILNFDDAFAASDLATRSVAKTFAEPKFAVDQALLVLVKALTEALSAIDVATKATDKPLEDAQSAADFPSKDFQPGVKAESLAIADDSNRIVGKAFTDVAYQLEGPFNGQTYVDPTYLAQDYAWDGFPIKTFGKALSDLVDATDDFFGEATADDDQVIVLGKSLIDHGFTGETLARDFVRPGVVDGFSASDLAQLTPIKVLSDLVGKSDAATVDAGKAASSTALTSESATRHMDRVLSELPLSPADLVTFSLAKVSTDSASTSDDADLSVGKLLTESFLGSDSAIKSSGKGLLDTSASGDAGNLRMTDYADITYFAQDYVGTSVSF